MPARSTARWLTAFNVGLVGSCGGGGFRSSGVRDAPFNRLSPSFSLRALFPLSSSSTASAATISLRRVDVELFTSCSFLCTSIFAALMSSSFSLNVRSFACRMRLGQIRPLDVFADSQQLFQQLPLVATAPPPLIFLVQSQLRRLGGVWLLPSSPRPWLVPVPCHVTTKEGW